MMTDYIACGRVVPDRIADIVRGIAGACQQAGTALVGGETAEPPGLLAPQEYDVAGAATGGVEAEAGLGPDRVHPGDRLVAPAASTAHASRPEPRWSRGRPLNTRACSGPRSTTWPGQPPVWSRPSKFSDRIAYTPATGSSPWRPAACTPTDIPSCAA